MYLLARIHLLQQASQRGFIWNSRVDGGYHFSM